MKGAGADSQVDSRPTSVAHLRESGVKQPVTVLQNFTEFSFSPQIDLTLYQRPSKHISLEKTLVR